jgi:protein-L-isoaspartate O-methyltransferase
MIDLSTTRRVYAEEIRKIAHLGNETLVDAFARVPRERFLGPGPWHVVARVSPGRVEYETTENDDPRHVYRNVLVAIDRERILNNGQPAGLAYWIECLGLKPGEGAVFVNSGATHPQPIWLDSLHMGGRLLLPITATAGNNTGQGGMFLITRHREGFAAACVSQVAIFSCVGSRDSNLEQELSMKRGSESRVRSLRRDVHERDETCWLHTRDGCLSTLSLAPGTTPTGPAKAGHYVDRSG